MILRNRLLLAMLLLGAPLAACPPPDPDDADDFDQDGVPDDEDCAPTDGERYPGAADP